MTRPSAKNKGPPPDELVQVVKLPPHLADYKPWMQEFLGSVRQAVRGIYQGYLGWFDGDPVALAPVPRPESAHREVELMGGRDRVLAAAAKAFEDGDPQWAAELTTKIIRINRDDMAARRLKAAAFRTLGYAEVNAIWRNWYLSGARSLEIVVRNLCALAWRAWPGSSSLPISLPRYRPEPSSRVLPYGSKRRKPSMS